MLINVLSLLAALLLLAGAAHDREKHPATAIPVRYKEGLTHGFLLLRGEDGAVVAEGDVIVHPAGFAPSVSVIPYCP